MDIKTADDRIIFSDPKVVICLGSSMPISKMISRFFERGYYGAEFIGIDSTMFVSDLLRAKGANYAYTSTVPAPATSIAPIAQAYRRDMLAYFPQDPINILSLSYYIHANIVTKAIAKSPENATKEDILKNIENMKNFDLGGFVVNFNLQTRYAYPHLVTIIKG